MRMASGHVRRRRVLVIDPAPVYRAGLEEVLASYLWSVVPCATAEDARARLADSTFDAVWSEWDLRSGEGTADLLLADVRRAAPAATLLIVTAVAIAGAERAAALLGARVFSKRDTQQAALTLAEIEDERLELLAEDHRATARARR